MSGEPNPEIQSTDSAAAEAAPEPIFDAVSAASPGPDPSAPSEAPSQEQGQEGELSFGELLREFESTHTHRVAQQLEGTVISLSVEQVFLDVGYKMEGVLPRSAFPNNAEGVKVGDCFAVSITGRNEEGYYQLSRFRVRQATDWSGLEAAFREKAAVAGTVTAVVKGGLSVDVGVRAFMPASRSGARDAAEMEALVGQPITCRITKLDVADENVVVDRRVVLEEQARVELDHRRAVLREGEIVTGTVRTLMSYGAFVDIGGGLDGLLHVSDISYSRIGKPEDVLSLGQQVTVRILKVDTNTGKISLGLKQLQPAPWETATDRFQTGQRVTGVVTRVADFGAFVELEPGLEGLIHISEMSWAKKVRHPSDLLKTGDRVDAVVLSVKPPSQSEPGRISLGLKQTLADPWLDAPRRFPIGSQVEGPVTKLMNFGAFVEVAEGIEGLVHIGEIVLDRRLNHPSDVLRAGQRVQAMVLGVDAEKRQMKLSIKQLIPTGLDEFLADHKPGDTVSGRVVECDGKSAIVELGEGIRGVCRVPAAQQESAPAASQPGAGKADLSSLTSLLQARWKGNAPAANASPEPLAEGQVRTFKIAKLDPAAKKIELDLV